MDLWYLGVVMVWWFDILIEWCCFIAMLRWELYCDVAMIWYYAILVWCDDWIFWSNDVVMLQCWGETYIVMLRWYGILMLYACKVLIFLLNDILMLVSWSDFKLWCCDVVMLLWCDSLIFWSNDIVILQCWGESYIVIVRWYGITILV
jgi:hypothetical protein